MKLTLQKTEQQQQGMEFQVKEEKKLSNTYNLRFICSDNNCDVIGVEGVIFFRRCVSFE